MCKECDDIRILLNISELTEPCIYAYVDEDGNSRHAVIGDDPCCPIDIDYCPFCGRKLKEEK